MGPQFEASHWFWVAAIFCLTLVLADDLGVAKEPFKQDFPMDCDKLPKNSPSGVYVIKPQSTPPLVVYCHADEDGKHWTIVQRNSKTTEITWHESWTTFKYGFGNVMKEFWLGNEYIHLLRVPTLTAQRAYMVRFVLKDKNDKEWHADYDIFSLDKEVNGYALRLGRHSGTAPDSLTIYDSNTVHDNMKFSTKDKDQDRSSSHCANTYSGWWYDNCHLVQLNAKGYIYWKNVCLGDCTESMIMVRPTGIC
ncbi:fibrinogen-like protein 1-like protein [Ranitomeya variabilis]|uniref:fibrinogen-like protein 1-like protein n=1 Tax=Ranitomeya variabilis TaxID=490064 RepID=UPI004056952E